MNFCSDKINFYYCETFIFQDRYFKRFPFWIFWSRYDPYNFKSVGKLKTLRIQKWAWVCMFRSAFLLDPLIIGQIAAWPGIQLVFSINQKLFWPNSGHVSCHHTLIRAELINLQPNLQELLQTPYILEPLINPAWFNLCSSSVHAFIAKLFITTRLEVVPYERIRCLSHLVSTFYKPSPNYKIMKYKSGIISL